MAPFGANYLITIQAKKRDKERGKREFDKKKTWIMEEDGLGTTYSSGVTFPMKPDDEVKVHDIDNPEEALAKGLGVGEESAAVTKEMDAAEKSTVQLGIDEGLNKSVSEYAGGAECTESSSVPASSTQVALKSEKLEENMDEKEGTKTETTSFSETKGKSRRLSNIDFSVFEDGFYRRYKSFFHDKLAGEIDLSQDKITVSKQINEHFSNFEINPVDVIRTFLVLRKNSEHSHGHFIMSPAQSPEPNINPSEGNTRGRRCANKDIANNDANGTEANSYKGEYKPENSAIVENHAEIGVSTRNSKKGRVSSRGRR